MLTFIFVMEGQIWENARIENFMKVLKFWYENWYSQLSSGVYDYLSVQEVKDIL